MEISVQRLKSCIWQEGDGRIELSLFRLLCFAATVLSFFVIIPTNYLHHLSPWISLVVSLFGLGTLLLFREACRGRYLTRTLFFLFLAALILVWFPNGSQGSTSYYFFILFLYVPIFFRDRARWLMLILAIGSIALLLASELYFPQWVIPFQSPYDRTADLVVSFSVTALCCSLMLWVLLRRYDREQQRLTALNDELQQNIAERAQAEQAVLQNRELLTALIEGTPDAIYVKDTRGRYLLLNGAAATFIGKSAAQALGRLDTDLFIPEEARNIKELDRNILDCNETRTVELKLTTASGVVKVFEASKGPLHDGHGNIVGLFCISRDVTESRRMAEELRKLNEELEQRVVERTARLEAARREQETFSYSVSHDLRGPLRHINSYTAILEEEFGSALPPEARQYMERIRNSSRTMGNLIDDLLELSRIGRLELSKAPVNLSELAGAICSKLQDAEPTRRVELVIQPGLQVHGDRVLLGQMLENLIGNAWKYSAPRECARIELGRETIDGRAAFFVKDNGVGFDMAYQDKLFGAFQRLHGSEFDGTGIGLATVKRIIERHNGCVWAHGVVDQGTTIYFTLP